MIRLIITGVGGRMGSAILKLAAVDPDFTVTHVLEVANHPLIGTKIRVDGAGDSLFLVEPDLADVIDDADVVIDFTEAKASLLHLQIVSEHRKAIVIGTTAIPSEGLARMRTTPGARAVISPNMSIGMNVLFNLVAKAATVLGTDYDAEIIEMHHKWKKDAPSGTAVKIREIITATDPARQWKQVTGRDGMVGERKADEIGVLSLRGGDVVGEHTVLFAGLGERLEVTHRAYSRDNFARGALAAAKWITNREEGVYNMNDVLGLH